MSAPAIALRPRIHPRRAPTPARRAARPRLRVIDAAAQRRVSRVRRMLWAFAGLVACSLIATVVFHVVVVQSQLQLDRLERDVANGQDRYEQLRLQVALLTSPERVVTRAQALGLVPSTEAPTPVAVPGGTVPPWADDSTATTLAESWPKVKPHLDPEP